MHVIALRFLAGALLGSAGLLARTLVEQWYLLANLEPVLVTLFVAPIVFGWAGLLGAASGALVMGQTATAAAPAPMAVLTGALVVAVVYATARSLEPRLLLFERRSTLAILFGAMAVAGAVYGVIVTALYFPSVYSTAVAIWAPSSCVSLLVFGTALLALARALPSAWRVPRGVEIEHPFGPPGVRRNWLWVVIAMVAISLATVLLAQWRPETSTWLAIAYLLPVYGATRIAPVGGGAVGAALAGTAYLVTLSTAQPAALGLNAHLRALDVSALLLLFWIVGIWLGHARWRELSLRGELAHTNELLRRDLQRVVQALAGAVEAKDSYTEGHLQRVHDYAMEVGVRLGLPSEDLEALRVAGVLHDVGKIGIPAAVLRKSAALDEEERVIMRRHPEIGARILDSVEGCSRAAELVRHHQERWDGRTEGHYAGYPEGLAGEQIPLGARIIAVVDAFDAMTTDRPYRARLPYTEAVAELRRNAGSQFDPQVVDTFLECLDAVAWEEGQQAPPPPA